MGGSCRVGEPRVLVGMRLKSVAQSRAERSIVDRAANLKQEIQTPLRDQRICCDLFIRRLTRKYAVPSVIEVPTRRPRRYRFAWR